MNVIIVVIRVIVLSRIKARAFCCVRFVPVRSNCLEVNKLGKKNEVVNVTYIFKDDYFGNEDHHGLIRSASVSIGCEWDGLPDDDILFYFRDEKEFISAFYVDNDVCEFIILNEDH
jgi:hypothetical protein